MTAGAAGFILGRRYVPNSSLDECVLAEMKGRAQYMLAYAVRACEARMPNDWIPVEEARRQGLLPGRPKEYAPWEDYQRPLTNSDVMQPMGKEDRK